MKDDSWISVTIYLCVLQNNNSSLISHIEIIVILFIIVYNCRIIEDIAYFILVVFWKKIKKIW